MWQVLKHDVELVWQLLRAIILAIVWQSCVSHIHDHFFEKISSFFALAESFELVQIEQATFVFVDHVKKLFDIS